MTDPIDPLDLAMDDEEIIDVADEDHALAEDEELEDKTEIEEEPAEKEEDGEDDGQLEDADDDEVDDSTETDDTADDDSGESEDEDLDEAGDKDGESDDVENDALDDIYQDLPEEDWKRLSSKAKHQWHTERKAAKKEIAKHKADYEQIETFVKDNGLSAQDYQHAVVLGGAIARNDPQVLEHLEAYADRIRKANNISKPQEKQPPAAQMPLDEINALIHEAYDLGADPEIISALKAKLKAAPKPPQEEPEAPQTKQEAPPANPSSGVDPEVTQVVDYFKSQNIPVTKHAEYAAQLAQRFPELRNLPKGQIATGYVHAHILHQQELQAQQQPKPKPVKQQKRRKAPTVSGQVPRKPRKPVEPDADPLAHALG